MSLRFSEVEREGGEAKGSSLYFYCTGLGLFQHGVGIGLLLNCDRGCVPFGSLYDIITSRVESCPVCRCPSFIGVGNCRMSRGSAWLTRRCRASAGDISEAPSSACPAWWTFQDIARLLTRNEEELCALLPPGPIGESLELQDGDEDDDFLLNGRPVSDRPTLEGDHPSFRKKHENVLLQSSVPIAERTNTST